MRVVPRPIPAEGLLIVKTAVSVLSATASSRVTTSNSNGSGAFIEIPSLFGLVLGMILMF